MQSLFPTKISADALAVVTNPEKYAGNLPLRRTAWQVLQSARQNRQNPQRTALALPQNPQQKEARDGK